MGNGGGELVGYGPWREFMQAKGEVESGVSSQSNAEAKSNRASEMKSEKPA